MLTKTNYLFFEIGGQNQSENQDSNFKLTDTVRCYFLKKVEKIKK